MIGYFINDFNIIPLIFTHNYIYNQANIVIWT